MPEGGHSFNPKASDHKNVLKKVIEREGHDLEKAMKNDFHHQIKMVNLEIANREGESDAEISDLDSAEEFVNKAVVRNRKMTE